MNSRGFQNNPVPVISQKHLRIMERLRRKTIEIMREFYPDAYVQHYDGTTEYVADDRPSLEGNVNDLRDKLEAVFDKSAIDQLSGFKGRLAPQFEDEGFQRIIEFILPSVMTSGPTSDRIRVSLQGSARCMDCFNKARRRHRGYLQDSSVNGFFRIHKNGKLYVADTSLDELCKDWRKILPTDVRLEANPDLATSFASAVCLTGEEPNPNHRDIYQLSTVITLEYVDSKGKRIRDSHVLHMRHKAGFEMARKETLWLIGALDGVTDGIGSRSIVPAPSYARVLVRTIRNYPYVGSLDGSIYVTNYTKDDLRNVEGSENLDTNEEKYLRAILRHVRHDEKNIFVKIDDKVRPARDIEWMFLFGGKGRRTIRDFNVGKQLLYSAREYVAMNGYKQSSKEGGWGQDDLDYQLRREADARDEWTAGHWIILKRLLPAIQNPQLQEYGGRIVDIRLQEAGV